MAQSMYRIHCTVCGESIEAEHVHGGRPNTRGGQDRRTARIGCWNRCKRCSTLYEALPCSSAAAKRLRRTQRRLERAGQLRLA